MASGTEPNPGAPRLTRHFAILGALVLCLAGVLMMVIDQRTSDDQISRWAEANNASLTQAIANSVWPRYAAHVAAARSQPAETLRQAPATQELLEEIRTLVARLDVLKVKLYDTGGMTVFSTQFSQIGADYSSNARFLNAFNGEFASKLEQRETFGAIDGPKTDRWVLSSYIPVRRSGDGKVIGVAEIYRDVTGQRLEAEHNRIIRASIIGAALAVVFASLVLIVWRSDQQITEYHRRELELVASARDADAKNQAKSRFLANISHEMRTPLNGILGTANLVTKTSIDDHQTALLDNISKSGRALLSLIDDILEISNDEKGNLRLKISTFKMADCIADVSARLASEAGKKNLDFLTNISVDPYESVRGDPERLQQVLTKLIGNAVKFTDHGQVRLAARPVRQADGIKRYRFEVDDTGIGISADHKPHIFESFFQAENTPARRYGGAGVGLSLARQIVDRMDGEMGFDSVEGKGSTFWIEVDFPVEIQAPGSAGQRKETAAPDKTQPDTAPILLAEDCEVNQIIVTELLKSIDCAVDCVENGRDAIDAWERGSYSLILMDIQMPEMDGLEATRQIRALEIQKDLPAVSIVAVTANALESDREDCLVAGMDDYLSKPFTDQQFGSMLDRWLPKISGVGAEPAPRQQGAQPTVPQYSVTADSDRNPDPIDSAIVEPLRVGKPDLWKKLIDVYLKTTPESFEKLEKALANGDCPTVQMTAHTLKSSSANLGATQLSNLCRQLELEAREGNLELGSALVADIHSEFDMVAAALAEEDESEQFGARSTA